MTAPANRSDNDWARPYWHASGEDASVLFFVFGRFGPDVSDVTAGLPEGIGLTRHDHAALKAWDGYPLGGSLGEVFALEDPQTLEAARSTPEVLRLGGQVHDPSNLNYLRDTLEAVTRGFDAGGVAAVDPLTATLFSRGNWRRRFLGGGTTSLRQHILVLCDEDPDAPGHHWVHTRGMRKFARPDLSLTRVPAADADRAGALCEQLVDMLALGGHFADGQQLPVDGIGLFEARPGGDAADPRFFNTHVQLRWPG